jgi:hypothetical protein
VATLVSIASGDWTAAETWGLCSSAAELDSESANTALTTSFVYTATFVPANTEVDAILVKLASRTASPSGTISIELYNNTTSSSVATVTANISDLAADGNGWHCFKFAAHTPNGADAYKIGAKTSSSSQCNLFRNATGGNWSRQLRSTTQQAPAAGDKIIVCGEISGQATTASIAVVMNETASTIYGSTSFPQSLSVSLYGSLSYGVAVSTNYYLKVAGLSRIYSGGTFNIGTIASPLPSSSTAVMEFSVASNVDSGLYIDNGGNFSAHGNSMSTTWTTLTADKSAGNTVIALADTTGWSNSDVVCFTSTTRTASQAEHKTISTVDSATQITLTAGLTNAHGGVSPVVGECGNISRNVKVRGISVTLQGYMFLANKAVVDIRYSEFYWMGSNTAGKRGIDVQTTTGSYTVVGCSFHDFTVTGSACCLISGSSSGGANISNSVFYLSEAWMCHVQNATSGTHVFTNNLFNRVSGSGGSSYPFQSADTGITVTGCVFSGAQANSACAIREDFAYATNMVFSNNTSHSNGPSGFDFQGFYRASISGLKSWRNGGYGMNLINNYDCELDDCVFFGNATAGIGSDLSGIDQGLQVTVSNSSFYAGTTLTQPRGVFIARQGFVGWQFINCTFGTPNGHGTADIHAQLAGPLAVHLHNCLLASSIEILVPQMPMQSVFTSSNHDQVAGAFKSWRHAGIVSLDTVIFDETPSQRLTPNSASRKLHSGIFKVNVASGQSCTPSVKVRKSVAGDGTAYNGAQPRLLVLRNPEVGVTSDTVVATATNAANGAWETISGATINAAADGVMSFYVDCDGTTGWVNLDTISATVS